MTELVTGGFGQGKLTWVLNNRRAGYWQNIKITDENSDIADLNAFIPENELFMKDKTLYIINHLHLIIKSKGREQTLLWLNGLISRCSQSGSSLIIICDELGCGIIPLDASDRQYREDVGRIMCSLAEKAGHVYRVICGIGQKLK